MGEPHRCAGWERSHLHLVVHGMFLLLSQKGSALRITLVCVPVSVEENHSWRRGRAWLFLSETSCGPGRVWFDGIVSLW